MCGGSSIGGLHLDKGVHYFWMQEKKFQDRFNVMLEAQGFKAEFDHKRFVVGEKGAEFSHIPLEHKEYRHFAKIEQLPKKVRAKKRSAEEGGEEDGPAAKK